jgi:hypothetical protein
VKSSFFFLEEAVEGESNGLIVARIGVEVATVEEVVGVPDLDKDRALILERVTGDEEVLELLEV